MKASGNGAPETCANNLLRITRGEVPYERVKGIAPRLIDRPAASARVDIEQEAEWLINTYEPRVTFEGIETAAHDGQAGDLQITAIIAETEE